MWSRIRPQKNRLAAEEKTLKKIDRLFRKSEPVSSELLMIKAVVQMHDQVARDIMVPRVDVLALSQDSKREDIQRIFTKNTYSRIPIYDGNIDNIRGILHVKDIMTVFSKNSRSKFDISKFLNEPYFVPESKKILDILAEFQSKHIQFAIVVDEYGGFSGIVTMEDIIEEIIGDVQDEFDDEGEEIRQLNSNIWSIDSRILLQEFNEYFTLELPMDEAETLGGFIIHRLGYIPKLNQSVEIEKLQFKILSKKRNSLLRIRVTFPKRSKEAPKKKQKTEVTESQ